METKRNRNLYIDAVRGLAAIMVVYGHTCFYVGMWFVPDWYKSTGLMFEIPLFFVLAGWSATYRRNDFIKTVKGMGRTWLQWIYFIAVLAVLCFLTRFLLWESLRFEGVHSLSELFANFGLNVTFPSLPVVEGSIWYLPLYMLVTLVNTIVMIAIERGGAAGEAKTDKTDETTDNEVGKTDARVSQLKLVYLFLLIGIFVWISSGQYFFGVDVAVVYYAIFWMIGQNRERIRIEKWWVCLAGMAGAFLCYLAATYILQLPYFNLQEAKFPPTVAYGIWSCIMLFPVFYFERKAKHPSRFLIHIGRNAIFYYFGQGVSTSIMCRFSDSIHIENWFVKFVVTFLLNLAIAIPFSEGLALFYKGLRKGIMAIVKNRRANIQPEEHESAGEERTAEQQAAGRKEGKN